LARIRASRFAAIGVAAVLCICASLSFATAQTKTQAKPTADEKPQPGWRISCQGDAASKNLSCTLGQLLREKQTGKRLLAVSIFRKDKSAPYTMRLNLPHGLLLTNGVKVWIDEKTQTTYPIVTADQRGSYAVIPLDAGMIDGLKQGTLLNVGVSSYTGGDIIFQLSLAGFTTGLAKI
jgi:invasion protein IalB